MNFFYPRRIADLGAYTWRMKRFLCLVLSCLLLFNGCLPAREVARDYLQRDGGIGDHGQTPFSDMVLSYPDPGELESQLQELLERASTSSDGRGMERAFSELSRAYGKLVSATSLAYVRHCQDGTNRESALEYDKLNRALYPLQAALLKIEKRLMDRFGFHKERGAAYAQRLDRSIGQDEPLLRSLRQKEDALCRRYELLDATYRLEYHDRTWTMEELLADETLPMASFIEALEAFEQGRNQAAGSLFVELIEVRNQMAQAMGYPSYAACQYDFYGREQPPECSLQAAHIIKKVFVPLYARLREQCENEMRYLGGATFAEDAFLSVMAKSAERAVRGAGEAWRYMLAYGLYDSSPSKRKLKGSFTTYFSAYRCPFVLTQWQEDASSVFTVIHEFGHFLSYYSNPEGTYYGETNLDLAELDAQGFELIMTKEYDAIFGRYATAARLCLWMNALYAILSGFMEDEFQQISYAMQSPSVDGLNELYGLLAQEYGFDELFGYRGLEWTEIPHTFQFPFYYVSYAVSMLGAMALVRQGKGAYGRLLRRSGTASFSAIVGGDVLSEEYLRELASWLESNVDKWLET